MSGNMRNNRQQTVFAAAPGCNFGNSTLLLVSHCAEVTLRAPYGCMSVQVTAPDVHEF